MQLNKSNNKWLLGAAMGTGVGLLALWISFLLVKPPRTPTIKEPSELPVLMQSVGNCNIYFQKDAQKLLFKFPVELGKSYQLIIQPDPTTNLFYIYQEITNCVNTNGLFIVSLNGVNVNMFKNFYIREKE